MNKVQIFRNHMAEKGFEYTIDEATVIMAETETSIVYLEKLSFSQFMSMDKNISKSKRNLLIEHLRCTEEEFDRLLNLIIDIRGS
tara:strand:- start:216 stop:470 length:255 start_codon:yes stop_codon:yes gene_type:complete